MFGVEDLTSSIRMQFVRILIRCILAMTYEISASLCSKELDERDGKITIVEAQPHQILPRWFASAPLWFTVSFGCSLLNASTDLPAKLPDGFPPNLLPHPVHVLCFSVLACLSFWNFRWASNVHRQISFSPLGAGHISRHIKLSFTPHEVRLRTCVPVWVSWLCFCPNCCHQNEWMKLGKFVIFSVASFVMFCLRIGFHVVSQWK